MFQAILFTFFLLIIAIFFFCCLLLQQAKKENRSTYQIIFFELQLKINSLVKKSVLISKCFIFLLSVFVLCLLKIMLKIQFQEKNRISAFWWWSKGFAHIGVLKVLEQAGVKIDYIGGTSMGAVVGGLYASGYNATQIDSIFQNTNFDELIKDYNPRISKSFYEKRNDEMYAITLPFDKFKLGVPVAFSKGLYNYNLLVRLTKNVRHINDFSKLPIPFYVLQLILKQEKK